MSTNTGDKLSPGNIVKQVYDNVNEAIKITGTVSTTVDTTGLATDAGQTTGNNSLASIDNKVSSLNGLTNTNNSGKISLDVNVTDITLTAATDSVSVAPLDLAVRVDFASSTDYIYKGWASVGSSDGAASWKICKISLLNADAGSTRWANGNLNFTNIWTNRASLSYS